MHREPARGYPIARGSQEATAFAPPPITFLALRQALHILTGHRVGVTAVAVTGDGPATTTGSEGR